MQVSNDGNFFFLLESCLLLFRCHILSIATTKQNREGFVGIFINFMQGFNSLDQASFLLKTHHFVYIACISHKQGHRIRNYLSQIIHLGIAPNSVFFFFWVGVFVCGWVEFFCSRWSTIIWCMLQCLWDRVCLLEYQSTILPSLIFEFFFSSSTSLS